MKELKQKLKNIFLNNKADYMIMIAMLLLVIAAMFTIVYLMMTELGYR